MSVSCNGLLASPNASAEEGTKHSASALGSVIYTSTYVASGSWDAGGGGANVGSTHTSGSLPFSDAVGKPGGVLGACPPVCTDMRGSCWGDDGLLPGGRDSATGAEGPGRSSITMMSSICGSGCGSACGWVSSPVRSIRGASSGIVGCTRASRGGEVAYRTPSVGGGGVISLVRHPHSYTKSS